MNTKSKKQNGKPGSKPENRNNGDRPKFRAQSRKPDAPPPPEDAQREYTLDGAKIKELGFSGGGLGIRANAVERDGHRYLHLTNHVGQSMTIYSDQVDWVGKRMEEFKAWKPAVAQEQAVSQ